MYIYIFPTVLILALILYVSPLLYLFMFFSMSYNFMVNWMHLSCIVTLLVWDIWVDLIILDLNNFDVILGLDCLTPYHVVLDFTTKTITLEMPNAPKL